MARKKIAYSHERKYSYWLDTDRYIYQMREIDGEWLGWVCAQSIYECGSFGVNWEVL